MELPLGRGPNCPSEWTLDRFCRGDLPSDETLGVEEHCNQCETCRRRVSLRREGLAGLPAMDRGTLLDAIEAALDPSNPSGADSRDAATPPSHKAFSHKSLIAAVGATIALAATALLAVHLLRGPDSAEPRRFPTRDSIQARGPAPLHVYRWRQGEVERILSGSALRAGDKVRFGVDMDRKGHVMVVGVESDGDIYPCVPNAKSTGSVAMEPGRDQILQGAVELDNSLGEERFNLVLCGSPFNFGDLAIADKATKRLVAPRGCSINEFRFFKEGR